MIPLMRTFLFIVALFNIPAVLALMACTLQNKMLNPSIQKTTKITLKIGIAKAVGGVLLALYMGLKYASMMGVPENNNKAAMRLGAIYLAISALVDIAYSLFAFKVIKRTKHMIKILKNKTKKTKMERVYIMKAPSEESMSGSSSCSEEERSYKVSQNNI